MGVLLELLANEIGCERVIRGMRDGLGGIDKAGDERTIRCRVKHGRSVMLVSTFVLWYIGVNASYRVR